MAKLLALTSRLPYPPREGHQLRSWHILRALAREHEVHLLSFLRDDDMPDDCAELRRVVSSLETFPIPASESRLGTAAALARGLVTGTPFVVEKFASPRLRARIAELMPTMDLVHVDMLPLAALVPATRRPSVLNAHNVEHELLERRIELETRPIQRWFLTTQRAPLEAFERATCRRADHVLACSPNDARQLTMLAPQTPVSVVPNGVDTAACRPGREAPNPASLIFVGQMSWFPNRDGVEWFLAEIFPRILQQRPDVQFILVGKPADLRVPPALAANVTLAGFVDDVGPAIQNAAIYVVPLRAGSGTRLKVLEAMAFGKAIVTTTIGSEGIDLQNGEAAMFADSAEGFASTVVELLADPVRAMRMGAAARAVAIAHYDWQAITQKMLPIYAELLERANHT